MKQTLSINGMHFYANHGYYAHEKEVGGNYTVDIELIVPLELAGKTDKLSNTINYEEIYQLCRSIMDTPKNLIETLALEILENIFDKYEQIENISVTVTKIKPPIKGDVDSTAVTFSATRN